MLLSRVDGYDPLAAFEHAPSWCSVLFNTVRERYQVAKMVYSDRQILRVTCGERQGRRPLRFGVGLVGTGIGGE